MKTIGMIGLGVMGRPMCRHMLAGGYTVFGYDPDPAARELAAQGGVQVLASPREIAQACELAIIVVGFDRQVEAVIFGEDGLMAGARPGLIIGFGSTSAPTYVRNVAQRLEGREVGLLDMPLTRGVAAAESGTMLIMGGGDAAVFEKCRPVMETFSTDIFHLGPFGSGQVGKMVNNMILWACMAANDEGLRFGEAFGVDVESLRAALCLSSASNFSLVERAEERPTPWAEKDMLLAQQEADPMRFSIPLAGHVKELIKALKVRRGYPTPVNPDASFIGPG